MAVLVIEFANTDSGEQPEFVDSYYSGQYKQDSKDETKHVVELTKNIALANKDSEKISVTLVNAGWYLILIFLNIKIIMLQKHFAITIIKIYFKLADPGILHS